MSKNDRRALGISLSLAGAGFAVTFPTATIVIVAAPVLVVAGAIAFGRSLQ